jgi:hypothetical protein
MEALGKLKGAHRLAIPLRVRHAKSATNVAFGVGPLLGAHDHNASPVDARNARNDGAIIASATIAAQLNEFSTERLKQFGGAWSVHLARTLHVTPRFGLIEVRSKLWRQVSVALVFENLISTIRHLACGVGNG